jgi:hypothetical protein
MVVEEDSVTMGVHGHAALLVVVVEEEPGLRVEPR